jgi:hypothetical protein
MAKFNELKEKKNTFIIKHGYDEKTIVHIKIGH